MAALHRSAINPAPRQTRHISADPGRCQIGECEPARCPAGRSRPSGHRHGSRHGRIARSGPISFQPGPFYLDCAPGLRPHGQSRAAALPTGVFPMTENRRARLPVGNDLGTTNSAVAAIDLKTKPRAGRRPRRRSPGRRRPPRPLRAPASPHTTRPRTGSSGRPPRRRCQVPVEAGDRSDLRPVGLPAAGQGLPPLGRQQETRPSPGPGPRRASRAGRPAATKTAGDLGEVIGRLLHEPGRRRGGRRRGTVVSSRPRPLGLGLRREAAAGVPGPVGPEGRLRRDPGGRRRGEVAAPVGDGLELRDRLGRRRHGLPRAGRIMAKPLGDAVGPSAGPDDQLGRAANRARPAEEFRHGAAPLGEPLRRGHDLQTDERGLVPRAYRRSISRSMRRRRPASRAGRPGSRSVNRSCTAVGKILPAGRELHHFGEGGRLGGGSNEGTGNGHPGCSWWRKSSGA